MSDLRYKTEDEAREAFKAQCKDPAVYCYLGEVGVFADKNGNLKVDFLTFDTNHEDWWREKSPLNRMGKSGFGRAWGNDSYGTPYVPIAQLMPVSELIRRL